MFDNLTDKLQEAFKKIRGHGRLSEGNIEDALQKVRLSLLEADVNFRVVKQFVKAVKERAVGAEVMKSLSPTDQFVKIIHEEMIGLLGSEDETQINLSVKPPVVIMVVGLQGAGKTTSCGKMALYLKKKEKRQPLLVPADVYRPAAIQQLKTVAEQIKVPVWDTQPDDDPIDVVDNALAYAERNGYDTVIIDTAGRLHIDDEMMDEVEDIRDLAQPHEILFVADAMTGQDAVQVAKAFNDKLAITGVVLTKMDGDARGGAALSIRYVIDKPIKFIGVGEKMDRLERFYPDRIASRILGMGDVLSLIEQAQETYDLEQAEALQKKIAKDKFTLEDFLNQMRQIKKMGSITDMLEKLPGFSGQMKELAMKEDPEQQLKRVEAIILSMTPAERQNHRIINTSRRKRIAAGSGTKINDVNQLLKEFVQMKKMMKKLGPLAKAGFNPFGGGGGFNPFGGGGLNPFGGGGAPQGGGGGLGGLFGKKTPKKTTSRPKPKPKKKKKKKKR